MKKQVEIGSVSQETETHEVQKSSLNDKLWLRNSLRLNA